MKLFKFHNLIIIASLAMLITACTDDKYADWKYLNEQWLEKHKTDSDFVQTSTGVCYKIIHEGVLRSPNAGSKITADYTGTLIDGTEFDSGTFNNYLSNTVSAWQEILPKLKNGGRCIIYVPYDSGYGEDGSGDDIPPYSTLIFEIVLVDSSY